jgi:hypothetical protein
VIGIDDGLDHGRPLGDVRLVTAAAGAPVSRTQRGASMT